MDLLLKPKEGSGKLNCLLQMLLWFMHQFIDKLVNCGICERILTNL